MLGVQLLTIAQFQREMRLKVDETSLRPKSSEDAAAQPFDGFL
jgi:hypothetical protein